jgi:hypothetical protein
LLVGIVLCAACGQKVDPPALAPSCNPATMRCRTVYAGAGSGSPSEAAAGAPSTEEQNLVTLSGRVIQFGDDYFDQGPVFGSTAKVSATGQNGERVSADYDGASFNLDGVLKAPVNWFLVEPAGQMGAPMMLPTLAGVDTRSVEGNALTLGVAPSDTLRQVFLNSGTDLALARAELVVHVVDSQQHSLTGVRGTLSSAAEVTMYRVAATWALADAESVTDDSGMLFFGNVAAGSALGAATLVLSGGTSSRLTVQLRAGTLTIVTVVAPTK